MFVDDSKSDKFTILYEKLLSDANDEMTKNNFLKNKYATTIGKIESKKIKIMANINVFESIVDGSFNAEKNIIINIINAIIVNINNVKKMIISSLDKLYTDSLNAKYNLL